MSLYDPEDDLTCALCPNGTLRSSPYCGDCATRLARGCPSGCTECEDGCSVLASTTLESLGPVLGDD